MTHANAQLFGGQVFQIGHVLSIRAIGIDSGAFGQGVGELRGVDVLAASSQGLSRLPGK